MRDEHGEPMDNNAALWVVLEYGALRVLTQHHLSRVSPGGGDR